MKECSKDTYSGYYPKGLVGQIAAPKSRAGKQNNLFIRREEQRSLREKSLSEDHKSEFL